MTKSDLIDQIAGKTGLTKKETAAAVEAYHAVVAQSLAAGQSLTIAGFGAFEVTERAAREGRNPQTGAALQIPAGKSVKFRAGKALKDAVN